MVNKDYRTPTNPLELQYIYAAGQCGLHGHSSGFSYFVTGYTGEGDTGFI